MTNSARALICPICLRTHRTFGAVISCHGAQLRQLTGHMAEMDGPPSLFTLLTGAMGPVRRERLLAAAGVEV